ncbi:unnamed protein product [Peniophora sp. CBMAI 1063]|nr:unnamed protein product [Peniophora sp. CBMAI 1063]
MSQDTSSSLFSVITSHFSDSALSGVPREIQLGTLDSELETIEKALYRARRMRNEKVGACMLPREVIVRIIEDLQSIWRPRRVYIDGNQTDTFKAGWMSVSHVCTLWREIVLSEPLLWSKPTIDVLDFPYRYIPDILIRSHSAPLDLNIEYADDDPRTHSILSVWLLPAMLRRARRLRIDCEASELIERISTHMSRSSDFIYLKELHVASDYLDEPIPLPAPFWSLPHVTSLSLHNFQVPWTSPIMSSRLTKLHLSRDFVGDRLSYDEFRIVLSSLRFLEDLHLADVMPHLGPIGAWHPTKILLPNLRQLSTIFTDHAEGSRLILLLDLPSRCVREHMFRFWSEVEDISSKTDALGRLLPAMALAGHDDIELRHLHVDYYRMLLLTTVISSHYMSSSSQPSSLSKDITNTLHLGSLLLHDKEKPGNHASSYIPYVPLKHLETISLDVSSVRHINEENLWPHLLHANSVRRLALSETGTKSIDRYSPLILDVLRVPHATGTGGESRMLFPALQVLAFPLSQDLAVHREFVIGLIDLIHARQDHGVPLHELNVSREAGPWAVWDSLRTKLKVTLIDYPKMGSPLMPESSRV